MKDFKYIATTKPVLFGILITLMVLIFYIITALFASDVSQDNASYNYAETIGRIAASIFFLFMLWRFGWLEASGIIKAGSLTVWIIALLLITYEIILYQFALFGNLGFEISDPSLSIPIGLNALASGLIEELPFRAIVLYAFIRLWGDTRQGIIRSIIYSSALFSSAHLIHVLLGIPIASVGMKIIVTFLSGIYYAALVLRWKTIWTVVLLHGVINAIMSVRAVEIQGFSETASALGIVVLLQIPLVFFGIYIISKLSPRQVVPDAV